MANFSHRSVKSVAGYTLIELIIYSALVTMIVGSCLFASALLISASAKDRERYDLVENEQFIDQKLNWLFYGVTSNSVWLSGNTLYVRLPSGAYQAVLANSGSLQLATASDTNGDGVPDTTSNPYPITNNHVTVANFAVLLSTVNGAQAVTLTASLQGQTQTDSLNKTIYLQ